MESTSGQLVSCSGISRMLAAVGGPSPGFWLVHVRNSYNQSLVGRIRLVDLGKDSLGLILVVGKL